MNRTLGQRIDWLLFFAVIPILLFGLLMINSFKGENILFEKQLLWIVISLSVFFFVSLSDVRFLRQSGMVFGFFVFMLFLLASVGFVGSTIKGAQSWFNFGGFSFQPSDPMKLAVILILAKYFSRRHVEIAHWKHIFISGLYALVPFALILFQPDFGSALVIFLIWLGMILVSGVSRKHLFLIIAGGVISFALLWLFVLAPYQKSRVLTFIHPLADIHGAGYNAYQSTIAVGSGETFGKGVGYGTQSRLKFLPEYETDFIFAAFAEEWGFVGVMMLLFLYGLIIWRILSNAILSGANFEMLFGMGLAIFFMSHLAVNIGMNIGLLPVTGIPMPLMSYGGSHLLTEFLGLGILMSMRQSQRPAHRDQMKNEFLGI